MEKYAQNSELTHCSLVRQTKVNQRRKQQEPYEFL